MSSDKNIPTSFARWDPAAKVGLVFIAATLLLFLVLIIGSGPKEAEGSSSEGFIPENATNVDLSQGKLDEIDSLISPLLRGNFSAFDGADSINSGEAVSILLAHLCASKTYSTNEAGASLVPVAEVDALFTYLFGISPPRGNVGSVAVYDRENELYVFNGSEYHPEYLIKIVSTYTLDDVVYIHSVVKAPVEPIVSVQPSEPSVSEDVSSEESIPSEGTSSEVVSPDDTSTEVTSSDIPSETETSSDPSSEIESEPQIEYNTIRTAIFTLKYTGDAYVIIQLRDA